MKDNFIMSDALNISIENVTKTYGNFFALKDVSLEIKSGEFSDPIRALWLRKNNSFNGISWIYAS